MTMNKQQARARTAELLGMVGIPQRRPIAWTIIRISSPAACASA